MTDTFSPPELPLAPDKSLEVIMRNLSAGWPRMLWMICSPNKRQQVLRQASFFPPKINVSSDCFVSQTQKKFLLSTESTNTTLLACGRVWTMLESPQSLKLIWSHQGNEPGLVGTGSPLPSLFVEISQPPSLNVCFTGTQQANLDWRVRRGNLGTSSQTGS